MIRIWAAISVVMFMLAGCASMPKRPDNLVRGDYTYTRDYITWLIKNEMLGQDVTGLSIALVDDQRVVWAAGFGYADEANRIPATPETLYRVGSLSKLFTATSVMQLVEQGRMDIDKPLQTYLPEFSIKSRFGDSAPITPRSIMTHHSGLPSELLKGMWAKQPESLEENVNLLRDEYVANPPNYIFSYSNAGVSLLGRALERVVQRDFAGYMSETLLRPLGMYHSAFSPTPNLSVLGAKAYRMGKGGRRTPLAGSAGRGLEQLGAGSLPFHGDGLCQGAKRRATDHQAGNPGRDAAPPRTAMCPWISIFISDWAGCWMDRGVSTSAMPGRSPTIRGPPSIIAVS